MVKTTVLVALLAAAVVSTVAQEDEEFVGACPINWVKINKKCYFHNTHRTPADCAEAICKKVGGNLVTLETKEQNDAVLKLAREGGGCPGTGRFWVG